MSAADTGAPIVESKPGSKESKYYLDIAEKLVEKLK
jgi:hypothetical protein